MTDRSIPRKEPADPSEIACEAALERAAEVWRAHTGDPHVGIVVIVHGREGRAGMGCDVTGEDDPIECTRAMLAMLLNGAQSAADAVGQPLAIVSMPGPMGQG